MPSVKLALHEVFVLRLSCARGQELPLVEADMSYIAESSSDLWLWRRSTMTKKRVVKHGGRRKRLSSNR